MKIFILESLILQCIVLSSHVRSVEFEKIGADADWPHYREFGQISAVTVDNVGDVYVFHRGSRKWDANTFNNNGRLAKPETGPITTPTIAVLNPAGNLIANTGKNLFYMPHGLTVDNDHNVWVTDVALHQVIKFPPVNKSSTTAVLSLATMTLGEPLVPGRGKTHFCKPTSVAIDSESRDFFVADGYCNSRVVKFDKDGRFLIQWGQPTLMGIYNQLGPYNLNVPHSLTLNQVKGQLMVADRENSRIICYTKNGQYIHEFNTGNRVYGAAYSSVSDKLYGVTGTTGLQPGMGLVYSMSEGNLTAVFAPPNNFQNAHDVAVSEDGRFVFAVELDPFVLWRFTVGSSQSVSVSMSASCTSEVSKSRGVTSAEPSFSSLAQKIERPKEKDDDAGRPGSDLEPKDTGQHFDATATLAANQLAVSIVTVVVLLSIIAVSCHMYRKKGTAAPMEMRGLIISDEEDRIL